MLRVMVSCGEPSGDVYAAALARALRERDPAIDVFGFGGPACRAAGVRLVGEYTGLAVTGITEVIRLLPATFAMLRTLADAAEATRPDALVLVDYPDFNFQLMKRLAPRGIPVVYYVTPQLWAWRAGRMKTMQRHVALALPIFPFEEALYRDAGVPVRFLGHPLVDSVPAPGADAAAADARQRDLRVDLGLDPARPTVALLPGSRHNEVSRLVAPIAEALPAIRAAVSGVQFAIACAPGRSRDEFAAILSAAPETPVVEARTDDVLAAADVVITASGTATAQTALHARPMVVIYKLSGLTYALGKPLVRIDTYAMANLIAGEKVVPELIQDGCTPEAIARETIAFLTDRDRWTRTHARLAETRAKLGAPGSTGRVADAVLEVARRPRA
ncbi:MAG: lipid-A-disaccharide synthase [Vicinamibacterales bacterium]